MTETADSTAYTLRADALALRDIAPCGRNFVYPQTLYTIGRKANGLSHNDVEMYRLRNINYWRKKMYKYVIEIFYSDEDEGYIAVVPELADCSAFGESEEAALREIMTAMELWLETAEKVGREIPQPGGKELLRAIVDVKIAFALHAHKGLVYNRVYLALLYSAQIPLWGTSDTLGTLGDISHEPCCIIGGIIS